MTWGRGDMVLGLIAEMLCGGLTVLGGVDDCSWEVWVVAGEGLSKRVDVIGEFCSGANDSSFD